MTLGQYNCTSASEVILEDKSKIYWEYTKHTKTHPNTTMHEVCFWKGFVPLDNRPLFEQMSFKIYVDPRIPYNHK